MIRESPSEAFLLTLLVGAGIAALVGEWWGGFIIRHDNRARAKRDAIAMEARSGETEGLDPKDDSAGPKDIAQTASPNTGQSSNRVEELLPCPHCGEKDAFSERADLSSSYIVCNNCLARGPVECQSDDDEEEPGRENAIAAWNRRTAISPDGVEERVRRLAAEIMVAMRRAKFPSEYADEAHDEFEALTLVPMLRAAISPDGVEGWQPIESAPRDGTQIIIGWAAHGEVRGISRAKWVTAEFLADLEGGEPDDFVAWWHEPGYEDELCANVWMTLPNPPAISAEGDE